jgi:hypothetical protein
VLQVQDSAGEALFDATTHAVFLPGTNKFDHYDTWGLWGAAGVGLDTDPRRVEHVERVFTRQVELDVPTLAPTLTLENPVGVAADQALRTAQLARGMDDECWQSLAGTRAFWKAGIDLDAYVGQLAALRSPCWVVTVVNHQVNDNVPDLEDVDAFVGLLRSVHSLSERSRVIVCHADYSGLPAVAAGAGSIGTGWDRSMRYFDPAHFQTGDPGIRIPASYVTQGGLASVLRRDTGDAIARLPGLPADEFRGGPMPIDDAEERIHHLGQVRAAVVSIHSHGANRTDRVSDLRRFYELAHDRFGALLARLPRQTLNNNDRRRWVEQPYSVLASYAQEEGLWT